MKNYKILTPLHKNYPQNLLQLTEPPPALYIKGNITKKDMHAVAIVGTRTPTAYGLYVTKLFTHYFVKHKFTIISGLARGIDTIAHSEALRHGGRTIAILGSGIDKIYPPENANLVNKIIQTGAVVTEFPIDTKPLAKNFLARNRIISGLATAVLVIEGALKSGTISTATHAANQNRDVFAIPGPINSIQSEAPNYLIKQGAFIATKPKDILDMIR